MNENKVTVIILQSDNYYNTWFNAGEMMICPEKKAEEWEAQEKVRILRTQLEITKGALKQMLGSKTVVEVYELIEECIYELAREQHGGGNGKVNWIEELRRKPLGDGRKMTIDLIFIPYCKNSLMLDEDETVEWITPWVEECNKLKPTDITERMIRQKFRRCPDAT